jgi:hypothetical protein
MEQDPHGISAHEPGAKLDAGKTRVGLVLGGFSRALSAVCEVGTYGAQKYTPSGWRSVPDGVERYTDAMGRHLLMEPRETVDPDSGLPHAAHVAWNALARLELMIREEERARASAKAPASADSTPKDGACRGLSVLEPVQAPLRPDVWPEDKEVLALGAKLVEAWNNGKLYYTYYS